MQSKLNHAQNVISQLEDQVSKFSMTFWNREEQHNLRSNYVGYSVPIVTY